MGGSVADAGLVEPLALRVFRSESCRTQISRIFRIFVPNFLPKFPPNFPRNFQGFVVLRFRTRRQKSPPFFNAKSPGKNEKNSQFFLESRPSKTFLSWPIVIRTIRANHEVVANLFA